MTTDYNSKDKFLTLSQLSRKIKEAIENKLGDLSYWLVGEIISLNVRKGHCYLNLIEKEATEDFPRTEFKAIIWAGNFESINKQFKNTTGFDLKINTKILFLAQVRYDIKYALSLNIQNIEPQYTLGLSLLERDKIIALLKQKAYYSLNKKKLLPLVPQRIAVISAEDSRGYEDFKNKIENSENNYKYDITLFSSLLQGEKAAEDMRAQLVNIYFKINDFDIVVIVRGGGGAVNLACFNNYRLAEAIAKFPIPVITGIGHTANISIADEVAFFNCITPTDVANYIISITDVFYSKINELLINICLKAKEICNHNTNILLNTSQKLSYLSSTTLERKNDFNKSNFNTFKTICQNLIKEEKVYNSSFRTILYKTIEVNINFQKNIFHKKSENIANITNRILSRNKNFYKEKFYQLSLHSNKSIQICKIFNQNIKEKIEILDPKNILIRGFSITKLNGKTIKSTTTLNSDDKITTILLQGQIESQIIQIKK